MTTATGTAGQGKATKVRFLILALITLGTMINYLDRTVISVAAPSMSKELGLNAAVMGLVFSAFSWTYAAAQIPGGIFLDRVGARITYFLSVTVWSVFTALQGFASGLTSLLAARMGLGVAEAPCFPANSRVLAVWFPQAERARANSVYSVGQYFGLSFLSPVLLAGGRYSGSSAASGSRSAFSGSRPIATRTRASWSTRPSSTTSARAAASATPCPRPGSNGATSASCSRSGRSSARRSASSPATRRWCSSSPGSPPTWRPSAIWRG
jgi:MFS family permease